MKQNVFFLILTSFPGLFVSFWFALSNDEKEAHDSGNEASFTQYTKQTSANNQPLSQDSFLFPEMRMDCILESYKILFNYYLPSMTPFYVTQIKK